MGETTNTKDGWIEKVKNDNKVLEWLTNIDAAKSTRFSYITFMKIYCECNNKTPTELVNESIKGIKRGLLPAERNEGTYISKFKECMKKAGYSEKSFYQGLSAVKSFYSAFDIVLSKSASRLKKPHVMKENQNFLVKEDVKKLIVNAKTLKHKAEILCMASSGMAIREIANLKVGMVNIDQEGIGTVTHRRQKTGTDYVTFLSPEATKALNDYWDERNRDPATAVKGKTDYAFVTNNNQSKGNQISPVTEAWHFQKLGEKLGYESTAQCKDRKGFVKSRSHALRKFFATTLENAGVPKAKVDYMLGHSRSSSDVAYFNVDVDLLKQLYIQYLPFLTFEKAISVAPFEKQLEELKKQNEGLQKRAEEAEGLKAEMEELKAMFNKDAIKALIEAKVKELTNQK